MQSNKNIVQTFLTAIKDNNIQVIRYLLDRNIKLLKLLKSSYTTNLKTIKYLVDVIGIDISYDNFNIIILSVLMNQLDIVRYLIDIYIDEYQSNISYDTNIKFFQELVTLVGLEKPNNVNKNNLPLFKYLVKVCNENRYKVDYYMSVFHNFDDLSYIKYAVEIGYKIDFYRLPSLYNSSQEFIDYILNLFLSDNMYHICDLCDKSVIHKLQLSNHGNINEYTIFDKIDIIKAMDIAVARCNIYNINHYIENGYNIEKYKDYLLKNVSMKGDLKIIKFLVTKLNCTQEDINIMIDHSYPFGYYDNTKYLMELIGNEYWNRTVFLLSAIKNNNFKYVKYFIKNGVNINFKSERYPHPIICAIQYGNLDIVKYLINNNIIIPDNILEIAISYGNIDIINLFNKKYIDMIKIIINDN